MSPEPGSTSKTAVFVVNADGTGFHRVTPPGIDGIDPSWSPDGTALVFLRVTLRTQDGNEELPDLTDIYFVLPDGSGLRRLTEDEVSIRPDWTVDGRVNFVRTIGAPDSGQYENWIMDADGGNPTMLGTSLAELTAAGCVVCPYPLPGSSVPLNDGFWPPRP
jgi:Tol biopolymer transport system component